MTFFECLLVSLKENCTWRTFIGIGLGLVLISLILQYVDVRFTMLRVVAIVLTGTVLRVFIDAFDDFISYKQQR